MPAGAFEGSPSCESTMPCGLTPKQRIHSCTKRGVRVFMKRNETFKTCVLNAFSVKRCI
jgi:hypothetical protein